MCSCRFLLVTSYFLLLTFLLFRLWNRVGVYGLVKPAQLFSGFIIFFDELIIFVYVVFELTDRLVIFVNEAVVGWHGSIILLGPVRALQIVQAGFVIF